MLYCGESNVAPSKYSIMDNKNHFESKVSDFLEALRKAGYSESTIRQYKKTCRLFIVYMDINYIQDCNVESIDLFLKTMPQEKTRLIHGTNYRLLLFVNYLTDRTIQKPVVRYVIRKFSGEIGGIMTKYLHLLEEQRLSPKTIDGYEHVFSYFLRHLSLRNVSRISDIGEDDVLTFISSSQNSKQRVLATMRAFCRYLYEQKLINKNIDYVIGRNRYIVKEKLPSTYTCEEVLQIESSVNQSTPVGKRDYAMLLLATRLGLRSSDIAGLQFSNLDWDRNIIRLIQYKTKREIELPLLKDVGEAICTAPQKLDTFGVFFMKYNYEIRLKAVKLVLEGGLSVREAGCHLGCGRSQVHLWVTLFERHGLTGLKLRHGSYSAEFKLSVLKHMHQNHLSLLETAVHFGIPGPFVIRQWERLYQNQGAEGLRRKPQRRRPAMSKSKTKKVKLKTTPHEELLKELEYLRAENAYLKKLQALVEERIVRESGKEPKPSKD